MEVNHKRSQWVKQMKNKMVLFFTLFAIALLGFIFLMGCNTNQVKVQRPTTEPMECHDMDRFLDLAGKMVGILSKENTTAAASITLVTTSYADCKTERKNIINKKELQAIEKARQKRFDDCRNMIYGPELLPKEENYKRYSEFLECIEK